MNLDDFKIQINKKLEGSHSFEMVVGGVNILHTKKINSIAHKIKKGLITEIVFGLFFVLVFVYILAITEYESIRIYFGVFTILISSFIVLLIYLLKRTKALSSDSLPVIENLKTIHSLLSEFVKRYFQFTMLLIPICLIFSGYLGYIDTKKNIDSFNILTDSINMKNQLITSSIFMCLFFISMYFFTKWYLKKIYGNHLQELQKMIEHLES
jgi:hypothetical protein